VAICLLRFLVVFQVKREQGFLIKVRQKQLFALFIRNIKTSAWGEIPLTAAHGEKYL